MAEEQKNKNIEKKKEKIAAVNAKDLGISTKNSIAICKMIRGKEIEKSIEMLEEVINFKRVVKMNNRQVGHKKGKGVMAGRYPVKTAKEFIRILKQLKANALSNDIELEEKVIFCKADKASRPYRSGGARFKRTNIFLKLEKKAKKKGRK